MIVPIAKKRQNSIFIWRVQDKYGVGVYNDEYAYEILDAHNKDFKNHPTPLNDAGIKRESKLDEICGFASYEQLCKWFSGNELEQLSKLGYNPTRVVVKQITAKSDFQVLAVK